MIAATLTAAATDHTEVIVSSVATVLAAAITGLLGASAVLVPYFISRRRDRRERAEQRAKVDRVHEHVVNTHSTNLREDIDEIRRLGERTAQTAADTLSIVTGTQRQTAHMERTFDGRLKRLEALHAND